MRKKYFSRMLLVFPLVVFFDLFYLPAHRSVSMFFAIAVIHFLLYGVVNLLGGRVISRPIARVEKTGAVDEETSRGINQMALRSSLWVGSLGVFYCSMIFLLMFLFPFDTGEVQMEEMPAILWLTALPSILYIYAVLPAMITWFIVNDFVIHFKSGLFRDLGYSFGPGRLRFGRMLAITFMVLGILPSILVSLELIISRAGAAYGEFSSMSPIWGMLPDRMAVLTGLLIALVYMTRTYTRPLHGLREGMKRVRKGDYSVQLPLTTRDEMSHLALGFNKMVNGLKEKETIRDTFGKYVTEDVAKLVLSQKIKTEGEERECTILMTDIANYTPLAERLPPKEIVSLLNAYFEKVVEIINRHGGMVNEFVGDAVFALFNVPVDIPDHAGSAIRAALEIQEMTEKTRFNGHVLQTRIGINSGCVVAGNIGSPDRLKFGVVGDQVNIAARLEQANKEFDTGILLGESTRKLAGEQFSFLMVGDLRLKGKEKTLKAYTIA